MVLSEKVIALKMLSPLYERRCNFPSAADYPQSKVAMSKMILFFDDLMKTDKSA